MRRTETREAGLTLVEILVAMLIFTVTVYLVLAPLTGLFGATQRSTRQITATSLAQDTIEAIKGQWQNQVLYNAHCVVDALPSAVSPPTVINEDTRGNASGSATVIYSSDCSAATADDPPPPMRKVTVTATLNGVTSTLVTEVAHP